jgi:hypothetical protein
VPLPGLGELAADAFTEGWLLSGCESEFTEAELRAAVGAALDCGHHPAVLEATLEIGKLAGVWKTVYDRRARLLRKHLKAVAKAWDACLAGLDPRDLVRRFRSVMALPAESAPKDPQRQWWQDAAATAAIGWLQGVYRSDGYPALVAALEDAIRAGMAEGEAGALALAASRQGRTGFRIRAAFKAAYERLAGDAQVSQRAQDTVTRIVTGTATDLGRTLAAQAGQDGSEEDMTSAADGEVAGSKSRSVETGTDWALYAAFLGGALALYSQAAGSGTGAGNAGCDAGPAGQLLLNWITAGDARVCPICSSYEDNSPYLPGDVPDYPHPRCRCSIDLAADYGSSSFLAALLDSYAN